ARTIAWTGHADMQSPQRVHAARKPSSGSAPGGRRYRCGDIRSSVAYTRRSTHCPNACRNASRRSPRKSTLPPLTSRPHALERRLHAEQPPERERVILRKVVPGVRRLAQVEREVEPGDE